MTAALLLLASCYHPPGDLPADPWQVDILDSEERCAPSRDELVACTLDGDTFDVRTCGEERVRLLGIDTPETSTPDGDGECFADQASRELARLLQGTTARLTFDRECVGVYGRTLAYVWLDRHIARSVIDVRYLEQLDASWTASSGNPEAILVNEYLLLTGYARLYDEAWTAPLRWGPELTAAERTAQAQGEGLWTSCP